jgi:hypothetical protein
MKSSKPSNNKPNEVYTEAMRYINNAIEILKTKADLKDNYYQDKKYVKMAGHTAYAGVLYAIDKTNLLRAIKKNQRRDVMDYQAALAKENKKMLNYFVDCYEYLHLVAGYDGVGSKKYLQLVLQDAQTLIRWASNKAA